MTGCIPACRYALSLSEAAAVAPSAVCTPPPCAAVAADLELRAAQGLRGAGAAAPLHGSALLRAGPEEQGDENVDRCVAQRSSSNVYAFCGVYCVFVRLLNESGYEKRVMRVACWDGSV